MNLYVRPICLCCAGRILEHRRVKSNSIDKKIDVCLPFTSASGRGTTQFVIGSGLFFAFRASLSHTGDFLATLSGICQSARILKETDDEYFELADFSLTKAFLEDDYFEEEEAQEVFLAHDDHPGILCSHSNNPQALSYEDLVRKGQEGFNVLVNSKYCRD